MSTDPFESLEKARRIINGYRRSLLNPNLYVQRDPEDIAHVLGASLLMLEAQDTERNARLCPPHQSVEHHNEPGCVRCKISQQGEEIADLHKNMQAKVDELVESQVRSVLDPAKLETDKVELRGEIAELLAGADADAHRLGDAAREIARLKAALAKANGERDE